MSLRCFLGHGASGTSASMAPFVAGLRMRGIDAAYPHLGHTLGPVLDDALDRAAAFLLGLTVD